MNDFIYFILGVIFYAHNLRILISYFYLQIKLLYRHALGITPRAWALLQPQRGEIMLTQSYTALVRVNDDICMRRRPHATRLVWQIIFISGKHPKVN